MSRMNWTKETLLEWELDEKRWNVEEEKRDIAAIMKETFQNLPQGKKEYIIDFGKQLGYNIGKNDGSITREKPHTKKERSLGDMGY